MPFLHGVEVTEVTSGTRPIPTVRTGVIGLVGTAPLGTAIPLNTPTLITNRVEAAQLGTTGSLPDALDLIFDQGGALVVVVRVTEGANTAATTTNVIGGVNVTTGNYEGIDAFLGAKSTLDIAPRILIAPSFTHQRTSTANAVAAKLATVAAQMRAIAVVDAPNTTDAKAIEYEGDFISSRVYIVDPFVLKSKAGTPTAMPASSAVAGVICRVDNEEGFWVSPSNKPINNIVGTARPIDFTMGDINARANLLNEANVATIIREDGYRLWGNRTPSADAKWQFLAVRRTADVINDSILNALLWAVDRGINKTLVNDVVGSVNQFLSSLQAQGAIIDGNAWADPARNPPEQIAAGNIVIDFDFAPTYPAERITLRSAVNNGYLTEIFEI
ncbi:MAG: phage tail protein [Vampirovibrio sp.]